MAFETRKSYPLTSFRAQINVAAHRPKGGIMGRADIAGFTENGLITLIPTTSGGAFGIGQTNFNQILNLLN